MRIHVMKPQTKINFDSLFKFSQISVTLNKTENRLVWKLKVREVIAYSVRTKQLNLVFFGRNFRVFILCKFSCNCLLCRQVSLSGWWLSQLTLNYSLWWKFWKLTYEWYSVRFQFKHGPAFNFYPMVLRFSKYFC